MLRKLDNNSALQIVKSRISQKQKKTYTLTVKAKDLPKDVDKDDLVAAIIVNAKEQEDKKEKPKFNPKFLIPIVLPIVLLTSFKGCVGKKEYVDIQPIHGIHYEVESPYMYTEGVVNAKGQEGMTTNILEEQEAMDGAHYNAEKQFVDEERASVGQQEFEQMEQDIEKNMEILISEDATQKEKCEAAQKVLEINKKIEDIYKGNEGFIEEKADDFEDSSRAFEDSNTEEEIKVIKETVSEYKENLGLTSLNIETITQIVELGKDGYAIEITGEVDKRGDYTITGEAIKSFAKKSDFNEAQKKYKEFDAFVNEKEQEERGI